MFLAAREMLGRISAPHQLMTDNIFKLSFSSSMLMLQTIHHLDTPAAFLWAAPEPMVYSTLHDDSWAKTVNNHDPIHSAIQGD